MPFALWSWWERALRRGRCPRPVRLMRRLRLEPLEDRTLLTGHTLDTAFVPQFAALSSSVEVAHASGFLADGHQTDLYRVHLNAGDQVNARLAAQTQGSG